MNIDDSITRVQEKIASRGLTMNAVAPESEVGRFEQKHGITLPADYRRFLTVIGNGGPGPADYGLLPLGTIPNDCTPEEAQYWSSLPDIRLPFPFTRYWIWEDGSESLEGVRDQVSHGSICIGSDGCGMYWHLIISGPKRGIPWQLSGEGIQPLNPERSFIQWYDDWLDGKDSFYGLQADYD